MSRNLTRISNSRRAAFRGTGAARGELDLSREGRDSLPTERFVQFARVFRLLRDRLAVVRAGRDWRKSRGEAGC